MWDLNVWILWHEEKFLAPDGKGMLMLMLIPVSSQPAAHQCTICNIPVPKCDDDDDCNV